MNSIRLRRSTLVVVMSLGLIGCQVSTSPTKVAQWDQRHPLAITRAEWNGQYTLLELPPDPKAPRKTLREIHLRKDQPLGFRQRETGVVAVAGDLEIPVDSGKYQWEMRADKGQTDPGATTIFVIVTVLVVLGLLVLITYIVIHSQSSSREITLNFGGSTL